jgi:hypothetical protein
MKTMTRGVTAGLVALALMGSPAEARDTITVGVPPAMYETVVAGVKGWNEAGLGFVVQDTGCGTGDISFCLSDDPWSVGGNADWVAWWPIGGNIIYVSTVSPHPFGPPTVAHELGHWLGLHYHSTDPASCMSDFGQTSIHPSDEDLKALEAA